jgi:hypothetical protein
LSSRSAAVCTTRQAVDTVDGANGRWQRNGALCGPQGKARTHAACGVRAFFNLWCVRACVRACVRGCPRLRGRADLLAKADELVLVVEVGAVGGIRRRTHQLLHQVRVQRHACTTTRCREPLQTAPHARTHARTHAPTHAHSVGVIDGLCCGAPVHTTGRERGGSGRVRGRGWEREGRGGKGSV